MKNDAVTQPLTGRIGWMLRQYVWEIRRELWGNRYLVIVPVALMALILIMCLWNIEYIHIDNSPPETSLLSAFAVAMQGFASFNAGIGMAIGCLYALNTFYNERKDNSILFWKSLPVSNTLSVLTKISIVLLIVPFLIFSLNAITFVILALSLIPFLHLSFVAFISDLGFGRQLFEYGIYTVFDALWWLPLYSILLAISACIRAAPIIIVSATTVSVVIIEAFIWHTHHIVTLIKERIFQPPSYGSIKNTLITNLDINHLNGHSINADYMTSLASLQKPDMWIGILIGIACLALTVWLRKRAEPI